MHGVSLVILSRRLIIKTLFADEVCKEDVNLTVLNLALVLGRVSIVDVDDNTFHNERLSIRSMWLSPLHMAGSWTPSRPSQEQDCLLRGYDELVMQRRLSPTRADRVRRLS